MLMDKTLEKTPGKNNVKKDQQNIALIHNQDLLF